MFRANWNRPQYSTVVRGDGGQGGGGGGGSHPPAAATETVNEINSAALSMIRDDK